MPNQDKHKTITFSFDGTGNEPSDAGRFTEDESVSNVLKLHVLMGGGFEADRTDTKTDGGEDQVTFYYNGIGTREEGRSIPLLGRLRDALNMAMAPRWGDAARILQEARRDFEGAGYEEGDRIVVFGFSRGAALARKFASRMLGEGLCGEVAFLGVFDTVAAMDGIHRKGEKISTDVVFENGTLHAGVRRAVHAVSLDETRIPFRSAGRGVGRTGSGRCGDPSHGGRPAALHAHSGLMVSAGGEEPRRVCVNDNDVKSKNVRDLPVIHHSVRQRFREVADYRPAALRGLKFHLLLPGGALSNEIHGISGLRFS